MKTGKISCVNGFTVEFKKSHGNTSDWGNNRIALVADEIPVGECYGKINNLYNKEDSNIPVYGIWMNGKTPHNMKVKFWNKNPPLDDTLTITYNK